MTPRKRFFIGGGGAMMPVLVSFLAIDIGAALGNETNFNTAQMIGIAIRYVILFVVGGFVAYLHEDEHKPFRLFEIGIAAPALITSLITAQGIGTNTIDPAEAQATSINMSLIGSAHASSGDSTENTMLAGGFFSDVFKGMGGSVYREIGKSVDRARQSVDKVVEEAAQETVKTIEKAEHDIENVLEKSEKDTEVGTNNSVPEINESEKEKKLLQAKLEAARAKAEAARAKAEALEKEYQASLAISKAAEAQAISAEQEVNRLEGKN